MLTETIDTACGPVEYTDVGTGEVILYFHGTGLTGDAMVPIELPLVESGFRLIVPNRPGYGSTPLSKHRSASDCADVAAALLDALNIDIANVMGSSGGGAFATASRSITRHGRVRWSCCVHNSTNGTTNAGSPFRADGRCLSSNAAGSASYCSDCTQFIFHA
jgi:hypothetical protein